MGLYYDSSWKGKYLMGSILWFSPWKGKYLLGTYFWIYYNCFLTRLACLLLFIYHGVLFQGIFLGWFWKAWIGPYSLFDCILIIMLVVLRLILNHNHYLAISHFVMLVTNHIYLLGEIDNCMVELLEFEAQFIIVTASCVAIYCSLWWSEDGFRRWVPIAYINLWLLHLLNQVLWYQFLTISHLQIGLQLVWDCHMR
jgi:hypothetical protein